MASANRSASGTGRLSARGTWLSMSIATRPNPLSASCASSASRDVRPLGRTGSCLAWSYVSCQAARASLLASSALRMSA
ncbi:hypothetical protein EES41_00415 [Streptomyces sp. ADI95-16]|nr:hypothetical protein EES41_00415 [Streptomyces sp. ADI95-16]